MQRPDKSEYVDYYHTYVSLVPDGDVVATLSSQIDDTIALVSDLSEEEALYRYAPDKWCIKEVIGHLLDSERMFAYRAMCFCRGDATPLPAFDQNAYVAHGDFARRPMADLLQEFRLLRQSTVALFGSFSAGDLDKRGTASGFQFSVRALGFIIAGHERHHAEILRQRYLKA